MSKKNCGLDEWHICLDDIPEEWQYALCALVTIIIEQQLLLGEDIHFEGAGKVAPGDTLQGDQLLAFWDQALEPTIRAMYMQDKQSITHRPVAHKSNGQDDTIH